MPKSPEQFNPSDEQYKKVEDLPEEEQGKFVDVPEEQGGGFVKKGAVYAEKTATKKAESVNAEIGEKGRLEKENRGLFDKLFQRLRHEQQISSIGILHEDALDKDQQREQWQELFQEKLVTGEIYQNIEQYSSLEEKISYIDTTLKELSDVLFQKEKNRIELEARERLVALGHDGILFVNTEPRYRGVEKKPDPMPRNMFGNFDGEEVRLCDGGFYNDDAVGRIGDTHFSAEETRKFFDIYETVAIDLFAERATFYNDAFNPNFSYERYIVNTVSKSLSQNRFGEDISEAFKKLEETRRVLNNERWDELAKEGEEERLIEKKESDKKMKRFLPKEGE